MDIDEKLSDSCVSWRCAVHNILMILRPFAVDKGPKNLIIKRLWLYLLGKSYLGICANIWSAGANRHTVQVPPNSHAVDTRVEGNIRRGDDDGDRGGVVPTCLCRSLCHKTGNSLSVEKINVNK